MNTYHLKNAKLQQALDVCFYIHGEYGFVLQTMQRGRDSKTFVRVEQVYTSVHVLAQQIDDLYDQGMEAFLLVAPSDECGTKTDTVHATWALACDFDAGVLPELKNPLLQPSIIIRTSPGRFHAVWLMDESIEPDRADRLLKAMARRLNGDVAFARINQMIRLPGFINSKHGNEVSLQDASNFERSFDVDTLMRGFDLHLIEGMHLRIPQMRRASEAPYCSQDTAVQIEDTVSEGATPALARLKGRRLAVVSEPDKKHMMDTGLVKQLTGDRYVNVRGNYANNEDLKIEFTLLMLANSLPRMRDDDQGIWRRMRVIPFQRKFAESEMVKGLGDQLLKERSGILNLFLRGAQRYLLRGGLLTPSEITAATADQRQEVDPLEAFINDKLKKSAGEEIPLKELFELYLSWKKENPTYQNMTKPEIGRRLEEKGYIKNVRGNLPYFQGLTVESLD